MEVHHHSHTTRKKWTHYFWEFLMLFLAVFLGFMAENQREHVVEQMRAKAYAQNLLMDLQRDTADIKRASLYQVKATSMIDSLVYYTSDARNARRKTGQLYFYMKMAGGMYTIDFNKATINQLISSGNLRYFTNQKLSTLVSTYNTTSSLIKEFEASIENARNRAFNFRDQINQAQTALQFWRINMDMVVDGTNSSSLDSLRTADFPLQNESPELMNGFMNALVSTKTVREFFISRYYPRAIKEATEIMDLLKKEYNLK